MTASPHLYVRLRGQNPISDKAVRMLTKNGFMDDAAALQRLKYASSTRNRAGPLPAKSDSPRSETTISSPHKRQRVQLRREAVKRRIKVLGDDVLKLMDGRRYHGKIFDVDYHEIYARWMYKVKYSDGDIEDYWTCEIDNLKCRCADVDHNHTLI